MAQAASDLLGDIDVAFSRGTPEKRKAALWHATDILLTGQFSDEEIWLFGEVIERLATDLELRARALLAERLGPAAQAPLQVIKNLAYDDAIEVAGPVLTQSKRIDGQTLVDIARTKGQPHLMAISKRPSISPPVTDVLVARGDEGVVRSVANNSGAKFSDSGFWRLVQRAENDSILAENLGTRRDIPRHMFLKLIAKASEDVRKKLSALVPDARDEVDHTVAELAGAVQARMGPGSRDFFIAKRQLTARYGAGELAESHLYEYARARKFNEAAISLGLLSGVPLDLAERSLIEDHPEMVIIIAKAGDMSWKTVEELLYLRAADRGVAQQDLEAALNKYSRLTPTAAKTVLKFYQSRRKATLI